MATTTAQESQTVSATSVSPSTANPAPLGLCAFALTTFVLSAANAQLYAGPQIVLGLALFYGGLAQLLAGMWEFRIGNTFGATAFSSYGAFWMAFAATIQFKLVQDNSALGFFLLGWTIFTAIMFLASFRTSIAVMLLFALLTLTFLALTLGAFGFPVGPWGGYLGIATALVAWYAGLAGLLNSTKSPFTLPIGARE